MRECSLMPEDSILSEAHRLVHGGRGQNYGHPIADEYQMRRVKAFKDRVAEIEDDRDENEDE